MILENQIQCRFDRLGADRFSVTFKTEVTYHGPLMIFVTDINGSDGIAELIAAGASKTRNGNSDISI